MDIQQPTKKYKKSKTIVYSCQYHIIFTPKYRRKVLVKDIAEKLKELIFEKQLEFNYEIIELEIMPDHVHLLLSCDPRIGIDKVIKKIKGFTANKLRKKFPELKSKIPCLWTRSRFISTVGAVSLDIVKKYIENQKNV